MPSRVSLPFVIFVSYVIQSPYYVLYLWMTINHYVYVLCLCNQLLLLWNLLFSGKGVSSKEHATRQATPSTDQGAMYVTLAGPSLATPLDPVKFLIKTHRILSQDAQFGFVSSRATHVLIILKRD